MFDDIVANGTRQRPARPSTAWRCWATDIRLRGDDPMGVDKFSRFNQTLQEYLDGAARIAAAGMIDEGAPTMDAPICPNCGEPITRVVDVPYGWWEWNGDEATC